MKRRINPVRFRLVAVMVLIMATLAFGAFFLLVQTIQRTGSDLRRSRDLSSVQLIRLFVELSYPGDWSAKGPTLLKGGLDLPSGGALRYALADYLRPRGSVIFVAGKPPAVETRSGPLIRVADLLQGRAGHQRPPSEGGPPGAPPPGGPSIEPAGGPQPAAGAAPPRLPDFPFATADGAGIVVRGAGGEVVGWIELSNGEVESNRRGDRVANLAFFGLSGALLVMIAGLGAIVFSLSKPIDRMAEAREREAARSAELASISCTDPLTGLLNRRGLEGELALDAEAGDLPTHVAMLDLDHFKAINDERGHDEGDAVLVDLGKLLRASVRHGDDCARWGGEEFVVLFHGLEGSGVGASAERIRAAIEAHPFGKAGFRVTATIGVAPFGPEGLQAAVSSADECLYRGKRDGRNRVVMSS